VEGLSYRIEHGLRQSAEARRAAIAEMAAYVQAHDVHRWVDDQLADICSRGTKIAEEAPGPR
jgi:trehalose-6-phosphate synthase